MACSLNILLNDELQRYVDLQAGSNDLYASPDEYIRELIRRDMEGHQIVADIAQGLREAAAGELVEMSVLDILNEE